MEGNKRKPDDFAKKEFSKFTHHHYKTEKGEVYVCNERDKNIRGKREGKRKLGDIGISRR